jgi:hypothetical protein
MAVYNTTSDAANTAVRAFLTKVGEYYLGQSFNTGNGRGKKIWLEIRDQDFNSSCAYCGLKSSALQIEHLLMFNRSEYGLHHPGNIVPCCASCNKRERLESKSYCHWEEHLKKVCIQKSEEHLFNSRQLKLLNHFKKYNYPELNENEKHSIRVIANSLYENIKAESDKSLTMYKELDKAFVK